MSTPIQGKVTNIIDEYSVAINVGSRHGVEVGMRFDLGGEEISIKDPDTGEELGTVVYIKAKVQVHQVYEKYSLASSYESMLESYLPFPSFRRTRAMTKSLPLDSSFILSRDKNVHVGDNAIQIIEKEEAPSTS